MKKYNVAVVGAIGVVGREMVKMLFLSRRSCQLIISTYSSRRRLHSS